MDGRVCEGMRGAFSLLECLIALLVFSFLLGAIGKLLLEVQKDTKLYQDREAEIQSLRDTLLYLGRQLQYAVKLESLEGGWDYFELDRPLFFSASFHPYACDEGKILKQGEPAFLAFGRELEIARVLGERDGVFLLDRKPSCGSILPIAAKRQLRLRDSRLSLDGVQILEGVEAFVLKGGTEEMGAAVWQLKLCTLSLCLQHEIPVVRLVDVL